MNCDDIFNLKGLPSIADELQVWCSFKMYKI